MLITAFSLMSARATELISNGGFEQGQTSWSANTLSGGASGSVGILQGAYPHAGSWYAYLGDATSTSANALGSVYQFITIPANATTITLSFYINIVTAETSVGPYDVMSVGLRTSSDVPIQTLRTFSEADKGANTPGSYSLITIDMTSALAAYKGQTVILQFYVDTDPSKATIFRIDDVSVTATTSCNYSLSPTSANPGSGASSGSFTVTVGTGCSWSAVSDATSWLHTSSSGSGNGTVSYSYDANTGSSRTGHITVGGQTFTVTQGSPSGSIVAGFDCEFFPAHADTMADLIQRTNLKWCGYYLDAPSQRLDTGWLGERSYLVDTLGWKIAPLYVGQQDPILGGNLSLNPSSQQGIIDGNEAVAEMGPDTGATQTVYDYDTTTGRYDIPKTVTKGQGFAPGTVVYLDWENAPISVGNNTAYIVAWCQTVAASNYKPGVYCPSSDIAVIAPLVTAYNVQFWAATWPGKPLNPDGSRGPIVSSTTTQFLTTDPATASATSLQYGAGYNIQTVNGLLNVDLDTSSLYGGSSPPPPTVSIVSVSPNPSSVVAGNTFTINAVVNSSQSQSVLLGASLVPAGTTSGYINDSPHDASVTLNSGNNNVSRQFTVPAGTATGTYDLLFAVWQDSNGNGQIDSGDTHLAGTTVANAVTITTSCTYSLSSYSASPGYGSGSSSFNVIAGTGCSWTASSDATSWLTTSSSGTGNGTVSYSYTANAGSSRTGHITVGGQTLTVAQSGVPCT
jgi:hypothetical protein